MIESDDTIDRTDVCGSCGASVGRRRYLHAEASTLSSFCSEACLRVARSAQRKRRWKARRRAMKVAIIGVAVAGACLAPHGGRIGERPPQTNGAAATSPVPAAALPPGWFGPEWPP